MYDPQAREQDSVCAEIGPRPAPDLKPYMCSLEINHMGVHKAVLDDEVLDTWPHQPPAYRGPTA